MIVSCLIVLAQQKAGFVTLHGWFILNTVPFGYAGSSSAILY